MSMSQVCVVVTCLMGSVSISAPPDLHVFSIFGLFLIVSVISALVSSLVP